MRSRARALQGLRQPNVWALDFGIAQTRCRSGGSWVPAPSQIGGLVPMTRTKTPGLPTYCGRQSPGSVPHLPTYSQAAQRSKKCPVALCE